MSASNIKQQHTPAIRQFQGEAVVYIPLSELHPFPNQPFKVREDSAMQETVESVRAYGVLTPAIVRPRENGGYEIVSGHRRKHASELAGADALPAIVREMDDDTAIILLVDSNIQREEILPSERVQALKMKLDAIRRKSGRPSKEKGAQVGHPSLSKSGLPGKNPGRPQSIEDTYRQKTAGKRDAIAVLLSIWPAF